MKDSITLQWTNDRPEGTDAMVIADIAASLGALKSPEDLHYHTVFLGSDMDTTPGVIVEGEHGNRNFICTYYPVIGDAFETSQPNLDPKVAAIAKELGLDKLSAEDLDAVVEYLKQPEPPIDTEAALRVFLRGRGGRKAEPTDEDFALGHDAIRIRMEENEQQDKGA
jgi:hypothetical protein